MHACSPSTPGPPPLTAVHSPSTNTHTNTEQNDTFTVQSLLITLNGFPPVMCCQCDIIHLHLLFLLISVPPSYAWVSRSYWNLLISLEACGFVSRIAYGKLCRTRKPKCYCIRKVLAPSAGVEADNSKPRPAFSFSWAFMKPVAPILYNVSHISKCIRFFGVFFIFL